METHCRLCRIPREPGVRRCNCGYVYDPPPNPDYYDATDPRVVHDGMPRYVPTGCFSLVFLLIVTGTNGTGMVVLIVGVVAAMFGDIVGVKTAPGLALTFGGAVIGFDMLSRRMLRCSLVDVTRGSQFMRLPVWMIGVAVSVIAGVVIIDRGG